MHNELDGTIRFDHTRDHHIRHTPGEEPKEYNAPEYEEISDADFVKVAIKSGIIEKKGTKYLHRGKLIGSRQSDVVNYINEDAELLHEFTEFYHSDKNE